MVKARDVFFGNLIQHDSFLTHYIVDTDPKNGWFGTPQMMHKYYGNNVQVRKFLLKLNLISNFQVREDNKTTIYLDFEHDLRQMYIVFPILKPNTWDKVHNSKTETVAKLKIEYKTIQRIFCDVSFWWMEIEGFNEK